MRYQANHRSAHKYLGKDIYTLAIELDLNENLAIAESQGDTLRFGVSEALPSASLPEGLTLRYAA
jgi:hypothetical protein